MEAGRIGEGKENFPKKAGRRTLVAPPAGRRSGSPVRCARKSIDTAGFLMEAATARKRTKNRGFHADSTARRSDSFDKALKGRTAGARSSTGTASRSADPLPNKESSNGGDKLELERGAQRIRRDCIHCGKSCRVPSSRKTIGKPKLPISNLHTLLN